MDTALKRELCCVALTKVLPLPVCLQRILIAQTNGCEDSIGFQIEKSGSGSPARVPAKASRPDEIIDTYGRFYRETSRWAHPTALSCIPLMRGNEYGPQPQLGTVFVEEEFRSCVMEIAATALFACFALRNSAAGEEAIDPWWRQRLYELAPQITGSEMPHLERDWTIEQEQYEELQQKVQLAADLTDRLQSDPRSWDNLKAPKIRNESEGSS